MHNVRFYTGVVLLAGAGLLGAGCGGRKNEQPQAPPITPVSAVKVVKGDATYYDEYPATVTALNEVEVRPQVAGYITGVFFTDGQVVRKGQKLYEIDKQQYKAAYDQAVANVNVALANLNRVQKDADRYNDLARQDAIARQVVDNANADLEAARMQVAAARANVSQVRTNLEYATIYAPFTGTIGVSQARLGAAVSPGQTLLNTISSDNPMAVDIQVDETQIPRFSRLQQGRAGADSTLSILLPGGQRYRYTGRVGTIDRAVDPQTGTIRVRLVFPNPDKQLKAGLSCTARIRNNAGSPQLLIPHKAVTEQMSEFFVYVATPRNDTLRAMQRKVTLGPRIQTNVVIKSGLRENETVVTEGTQKLREGAAIRLTNGS